MHRLVVFRRTLQARGLPRRVDPEEPMKMDYCRPARLCASALGLACVLSTTGAAALEADTSVDAQALVRWVLDAGDNAGAPFAVVDKRQARLTLFDGQGRALAHTPVLLGLARGDLSVPGIGEREMKDIRPEERTTPAGRFMAEPGRNADGDDVFWIDYDAAVSMHRVRVTDPAERRLQRLASPTSADNRISYGCINVPARFYDRYVKPLLSGGRSVVYLLPDTLPVDRVFPGLRGARSGN
ncbi:L,D-transpeptidase [Rubrivivax sp. RP6-9]|uniref:L,D-transpeptidase n=1 Tax=Rubrivivax sp. RP6-9 TaxID=3415750 RepID=UPI003CC69C1A